MTFTWTIAEAPAGSKATLNGNLTPQPTLTPDLPGNYKILLAVNDGELHSETAQTNITAMQKNIGEKTLVIRTVGTGPDWGQEPFPAWWGSAETKDAEGYKLVELELGRDSNFMFSYATLVHLKDISDTAKKWSGAERETKWAEFKTAHTIDTFSIQNPSMNWAARSVELREALIKMMDKLFAQENPTRIVLNYSGHGGDTSFFENMLLIEDAQIFLAHLRKLAGDRTLILDFSTNCNVGTFGFLAHYSKYADFLIASEQSVGGFDPGNVTTWLKYRHDTNLHEFFNTNNSTLEALNAVLIARQNVWGNAAVSLIAEQSPQSVALYDLRKFDSFMHKLKTTPSFSPSELPQYAMDLGTYALTSSDTNLANEFHSLRFKYVSDRDLVTWKSNTLGLSVFNLYYFSQKINEY